VTEVHPEWQRRHRSAATRFLPWIEEVAPLEGRVVLEYGSGQGAVSCAVAQRAGRLIGYDIDAEEVELAVGHAARLGLTNTTFAAVPAGDILSRVRAHAGQVDVVLLYAVLEHLTVAERVEVLTVAREIVRPDGHIVICESPNRLTGIDHHTAQMPFFHALPPDLAARVYATSARDEFVEAVDEAGIAGGPEARDEALVRWGTGVSFHELELVFDDLAARTVLSSYHPSLYPARPVRGEELTLAATLDAWRPDLPPCFSRTWLDLVLRAGPAPAAAVHVRPWQLRLPHDVEGVAMLPDGRLELRPGARLPVRFPAATAEVHVGVQAAEPADALIVEAGGAEVRPTAHPTDEGVPPWHAVAQLAAPADEVVLALRDGGCLTYVGYAGPAEPGLRQGRAMGW